MKYALAFLVSVSLAACADGVATSLPTAPTPSPRTFLPPASEPGHLTRVETVVVGSNTNGICIEGATLEVVGGQRVGDRVEQVTPCNGWDFGNGAILRDVVSGDEMTIRASAPGYAGAEMTIIPSYPFIPFIVFRLSQR